MQGCVIKVESLQLQRQQVWKRDKLQSLERNTPKTLYLCLRHIHTFSYNALKKICLVVHRETLNNFAWRRL